MQYLFFFSIIYILLTQNTNAQISPLPLKDINIQDKFWSPKLARNNNITIPHCFEQCFRTGRVKNFEIAAGRVTGEYCTSFIFDDTDVYKTIEAASYALMSTPNPQVDYVMDSLIEIIAEAQEDDGYLFTVRTISPQWDSPNNWMGPERWSSERDGSHELYNAGHLYEAAAVHYLATGKTNLLDIALKNFTLINSVFGPGRLEIPPGHEVIELGLVKLFEVTGDKKFLNLARFFIEQRGRNINYKQEGDVRATGKYWQDHLPFYQQDEAVGHAVRAGYLYAGATDVARYLGIHDYDLALDKIWRNIVEKKIYIIGSVGAHAHEERFGDDYDLPNLTAYNETCAAIAQILWNYRLFLYRGESKYLDVLERILYNGFLSGVGVDGKSFFYSNTMEIQPGFMHKALEKSRSPWFTCSCCIPNIARILAQMPQYIYGVSHDRLFVNLYIGNQTRLKNGIITINTKMPWIGSSKISLTNFPYRYLAIRIPGWLHNRLLPDDLYQVVNSTPNNKITIKINGKPVKYNIQDGYAVLDHSWGKHDVVLIEFPVKELVVKSHPNLKENAGKIAIQRGPIIYCAEGIDNTLDLGTFNLTSNREIKYSYQNTFLMGMESWKLATRGII